MRSLGHDVDMEERRYQVFVSSTYRDLTIERQEIFQALLELDAIPAGMEMFPASNDAQWQLIKQVIDLSDYYVVVVGGRYGSVSQAGISYTEQEYDYAVERGIPVLGFVHRDPDQMPAGKTEIDTAAREKLDGFRAKVKSRMCRDWATPEELGGAVSRSLIQEMKKTPQIGWIRGDSAMTAEVREQIAEMRLRIKELEEQLTATTTSAPAGAEDLASGDEQYSLAYTNSAISDDEVHVADYSWNDIMKILGPAMFDEASEKRLKEIIDDKLKHDFGDEFLRWPRVTQQSFHEVLVQLFALGVVEKSPKNHGVKDTQPYWRLSEYGSQIVMKLMAIRRDADPGAPAT